MSQRFRAPGADIMTDRFMAQAIALAIENVRSGKGGPFAALVVKDGKIIARGTNRVTSTHDPTAHAEMMAIRRACRRLKSFQLAGCEVYASCEPCPMCMAALYWARPAKVFYASSRQDAARAGFDDSFIYRQLRLPPGRRSLPTREVMREEALKAFRRWHKKRGKIRY